MDKNDKAANAAEAFYDTMLLNAKLTMTALTAISQQLYTIELQLADALVDKVSVKYTNKCLSHDKEMVGQLVEIANEVATLGNDEEEDEQEDEQEASK